ncbi:MAG: hypothetical protein SF029_17755 [bacterium]|nr:hypothetical protein [bacterium]
MMTGAVYEQGLYLRDGYLVLTEAAIRTLNEAGLSGEMTDSARKGLILTEASRFQEILDAFGLLMERLSKQNAYSC